MTTQILQKNRTWQALVILLAFCIHQYIMYYPPFKGDIPPEYSSVRLFINYLIGLPPIIIALILLLPKHKILFTMGISKGFFTALLFGAIVTIPMSIGGLLLGDCNTDLSINKLVHLAAIAGFMEEFFFRGFLFGLLFRFTKWGFIPSILITSVIFGILHLYQSNDILSALGVFGVTAFGSIMFAWVYVEWNYNLWCAISLHTFMNLWWVVFSLSTTAQGDMLANIFRVLTIVLVVASTVIYKKKNNISYQINRKTMWINT